LELKRNKERIYSASSRIIFQKLVVFHNPLLLHKYSIFILLFLWLKKEEKCYVGCYRRGILWIIVKRCCGVFIFEKVRESYTKGKSVDKPVKNVG
jgi:hypothetical protein